VRRLRPTDQVILKLDSAGYSGKEIAEQVNMTPGSVRVRLCKVRQKLKVAIAAGEKG